MKTLSAILALTLSSTAFGQTVATMGYLYPGPVPVAPGQLITVFLTGSVQGNVTATVQNLNAPVIEVRAPQSCSPTPCTSTTAVTIQIPYAFGPSCIFTNPSCNLAVVSQLIVSVNGVAGTPFNVTPQADSVHILTACDTVLQSGSGMAQPNGLPCAPLLTHANGSMVSAASPAVGGEALVAYAVGLGLTNPRVPTGQPAFAAPTTELYSLDFNFRPNALPTKPPAAAPFPGTLLIPQYAGTTPGYIGLYQVNFVVPQPPAGTPACSSTVISNLTISVGATSFDGAGICVMPTN